MQHFPSGPKFENYEEHKTKIKNAIVEQEVNKLRRLIMNPNIPNQEILLAIISEIRDEILLENPNVTWDFLLTSSKDGKMLTIFKSSYEEVERLHNLLLIFERIQKNENIPVPSIDQKDYFILERLLYVK